MTTRMSWCFGPEGAVVHHEDCRYEVALVGTVLRCGCPCHEGRESARIVKQARGNGVVAWENVASPQGALTPAGSDHLPELAERG